MRSNGLVPRRVFLVTCMFANLHGQPTLSLEQARRNAAYDLDSLISMARSAPPEFGADVLIRIVDAGRIPDRRMRRDLLEQAFNLAAYAQESTAQKSVEVGGGSKSTLLNVAFAQGMDVISLRARAARAFLKVDVSRARELFETIELPLQPRFTCDDEFGFDPSIYYSVMLDVFNAGFPPEQVERLLERHVPRLRSVAQVQPFVHALIGAKNVPNLTAVVDSFSERLTRLDQDVRSFSSSFPKAISALGQLAAVLPEGSRERVVQMSRVLVIDGLKTGLCGHRTIRERYLDGSTASVLWVSPADLFNQILAPLSASNPRIEPGDFAMPPVGPRASLPVYSDDWRRFDAMESLLARENEDAKESVRWKNEMEKYIALIGEWKGGNDRRSAFDYYAEKWYLLSAVLNVKRTYTKAPSTPAEVNEYWRTLGTTPRAHILGRDRVSLDLLDLFDGSAGHTVFSQRRLAWFAPVHQMLVSSGGLEQSLAFANLYTRSRDLVLNLYGRLILFLQPQ